MLSSSFEGKEVKSATSLVTLQFRKFVVWYAEFEVRENKKIRNVCLNNCVISLTHDRMDARTHEITHSLAHSFNHSFILHTCCSSAPTLIV